MDSIIFLSFFAIVFSLISFVSGEAPSNCSPPVEYATSCNVTAEDIMYNNHCGSITGDDSACVHFPTIFFHVCRPGKNFKSRDVKSSCGFGCGVKKPSEDTDENSLCRRKCKELAEADKEGDYAPLYCHNPQNTFMCVCHTPTKSKRPLTG